MTPAVIGAKLVALTPFLRQLDERARGTSDPIVVITVVAGRGSIPTVQGARLAVVGGTEESEPELLGTIGGGKIEAAAIRLALSDSFKSTHCVTWNLQQDIGMTCGGEITLFFERLGDSPWTIAIFGAGHVAQALVRVLLPLDCQLIVRDNREEWIKNLPSDAPNLDVAVVSDLASEIEKLPVGTHVLLMTQGHSTDVPILARILSGEVKANSIGVIGSASKAAAIRRDLRVDHQIEAEIGREFRCPIGLPIGDNSPAEIAISIVAELLQLRDAC